MKKILLLLLGYLLLPLVTFSIIAQVSVTGMVKNAEDDSPLPGVNILIKGTSLGTVTDIDGNYNLNVPDENSGGNLTFSYVGFLNLPPA